MKKIINLLVVVATIVVLSCTKDFIVKDIKNATLTINAPADNLNTPNNTITFWWEELNGAEKYNIQIVKPNFNSVAQLIVDTNIAANKFNHTFAPGTYQWRIKATNAGGSTAYITRTLVIDSTSNMANVSVSLIAPFSGAVTANNSISFSWNPLYAADYYELTLTNIMTNSITTISNITSTNYNLNFPTISGTEEKYNWKVKAFNTLTGTQTLNNVLRTFKIDHKSPFVPSITSPNTYSISFGDTTYLKWNRNTGSMDIKYDVLSISTDSTFVSIAATQTITTLISTRINTFYTYSGTPTKYWWQVVSIDSVGNTSLPSASKRFYLK